MEVKDLIETIKSLNLKGTPITINIYNNIETFKQSNNQIPVSTKTSHSDKYTHQLIDRKKHFICQICKNVINIFIF
jgi:hypothetical protein